MVAVAMLGSLLWWLVPQSSESDLITDTRSALEAWARFASSGDVRALDGHFLVGGPQYLQLQSEASSPVGDGDDYSFKLQNAEIVNEGLITGTVTVYRNGLLSSSHRWEIELRLSRGRWQIWTVRTLEFGH